MQSSTGRAPDLQVFLYFFCRAPDLQAFLFYFFSLLLARSRYANTFVISWFGFYLFLLCIDICDHTWTTVLWMGVRNGFEDSRCLHQLNQNGDDDSDDDSADDVDKVLCSAKACLNSLK